MPRASESVSGDQERITARLIVRGDPEGLRRLLARHGGTVRRALREEFPSLVDDPLLDDVMNLAALRVWRARHRFDADRGTLRSWLFTIARNCAHRMVTTRKRGTIRFIQDLDRIVAPSHELDVGTISKIHDVRRCIARLPGLQREVILADLATGGVLGKDLGIAESSVRNSRSRALKKLRRALAALGYPFTRSSHASMGWSEAGT